MAAATVDGPPCMRFNGFQSLPLNQRVRVKHTLGCSHGQQIKLAFVQHIRFSPFPPTQPC